MISIFITLWALVAQPTPPVETTPSTVFGLPIASIDVAAPDDREARVIKQSLEIVEGERLDRRALRRAVKRLYLTGPFADVQVWAQRVAGQVHVHFVLKPALHLESLTLKGVTVFSKPELLEAMNLKLQQVIDADEAKALALKIRDLYARRGFPRSRVRAQLNSDGSGATQLSLEVNEGLALRVRSIALHADGESSRRSLQSGIRLRPGDVFDRASLEEQLHAIYQRDRQAGYLEAHMPRVEHSPSVDLGATLNVVYRRGPRYFVSLRGFDAVAASNLRRAIEIRPEAELGLDELARLAGQLRRHLLQLGYAGAQVEVKLAPGPQPNSRRLLFGIKAGPRTRIADIRIHGAQGLSSREIRENILAILAEGQAERANASPVDPGDLDVLLSHAPGRPRLATSPEVPMTTLRVIDPEQLYDPAQLREAADRIEDMYHARGFLSARLHGPTPRWLNDARQVIVHFNVDEGVQTRLHSVRIRGNNKFSAADLLRVSALSLGQALDLSAVNQARTQLLRVHTDAGFAFARVVDEIHYSPDHTRADLEFRITQGPEVHIGRVLIRGNDHTATAVVRDRLLIDKGQLYSATRIEESRQRLLGLGLFASAELGLVEPGVPEASKDLRVDLTERMPRVFELNVGASVEDGPRASVVIAHRNILGVGLGARTRLKINYPRATYLTITDQAVRERLEQRFDLEFPSYPSWVRDLMFTEGQALMSVDYPKIFGLPVDTAGHASLIALRENRSAFTLNKVAALLSIDLRPADKVTLVSAVEIEGTDFLCYAAFEGRYRTCGRDEGGLTRRQDTGQLGQFTLRQEAVIDGRDHPFRPHVGYHLAGTADLSLGGGVLYGDTGIGPGRVTTSVSSNYLKLSSSASGYLPLMAKLTLALQARVGNIFGMSDSEHVPLYKKFFLGGTSNVRGFDEDRVLPADGVARIERQMQGGKINRSAALSVLEGSSGGGRFFWNFRSELRFPVSRELDLGLFIDAGELLESVSNLDLSAFSAGGGVGARWNTPVGPIALDLGIALKDPGLALREDLGVSQGFFGIEERARVHLSIGYF